MDPSQRFPKEEYDALADLAHAPPPDQQTIAPLAAVVSGDLKRRGCWTSPDPEAPRPPRDRGIIVIVVLVGWLALLLGAALLVGWIMALPFIAVIIPVLFLELHRRRSEAARRNRLARSACPTCAYDLSGLPDDLPREWVVGSSGPRRCPECGTPWPRVPGAQGP